MGFSFVQIIQLIGSLALFIYGMKVMSDGIQKSAGARFRDVVNAMTSTRFLGILTGIFGTFLIQSSSVTSVMVVSLANAGILSLAQSISVIMGANIGTTVTAWLLSLVGFTDVDSSVLSLALLPIGLIMLLSKRDRLSAWGEAIIGLGLLFLGLRFIQTFTPDLQANAEILEFVKSYSYEGTSFLNRIGTLLLFVLIGGILAVILQSSTTAVALTLVLTAKGWLPLPLAMAIVLGENVGTTATANIAALVGNVNAKRAALAHFFFNLFGLVWAFMFFGLLMQITISLTIRITDKNPLEEFSSIPVALAIFHSIFNITNTLLVVGFTTQLAQLCTWILPKKQSEIDDTEFEILNKGQVTAPIMSILRVKKEIHSMVKLSLRSYQYLPKMLMEGERSAVHLSLNKVKDFEAQSDRMQVEIVRFLSKVSEQELSNELSEEIRALISSANYLERINDLILKCAYNLNSQREKKAYFTPEQRKNIQEIIGLVEITLIDLEESILLEEIRYTQAMITEESVDASYRKLRKDYLKKIEKGRYTIQSGLFYMDLLSDLERIADHVLSVSENLKVFNRTKEDV